MSSPDSYSSLFEILADTDLEPWIEPLRSSLDAAIHDSKNGHLPKWLSALDALPSLQPSDFDLNSAAIRIGYPEELDTESRKNLAETLRAFHPWRKGPFDFFGTYIDTEWRSDMKWDRLKSAISPLHTRLVLDIGSGNGYHCWRMAGEGAKLALGTDPFLLYVMQHFAVRRYLPNTPVFVIPFGVEDLPPAIPAFDTVFSMGVLYHQRSPLDHLLALKSFLRPGGELVLETLVVDGAEGYTLLPKGRYAKMRNIWFIPSPATLNAWLVRCGYQKITLVDLSPTSVEEQRRTEWMHFESLINYLDPSDPSRTIEGYPAPKRAIFIANSP